MAETAATAASANWQLPVSYTHLDVYKRQPPPSDFIDVKGQLVHLRDEGPRHDPLPIVLIHGTSSSLHTWQGWARELRGQRRVISFDLPGFGLTGPFTGQYPRDDYHGDRYAQFVLDLLDHLQVPRAVIVGNSLGGEVAWRTAYLAPQRVAGLVPVSYTHLEGRPEEGHRQACGHEEGRPQGLTPKPNNKRGASMKKVVTVSLGSSQQDFTFQTDFLGERFEISRLGADDDTTKAWELMRRHQASADAIGLGEIGDHYQVGQSTLVNKETRRLLKVVTRVPATTGATLRRLLQVRGVRQVQKLSLIHI